MKALTYFFILLLLASCKDGSKDASKKSNELTEIDRKESSKSTEDNTKDNGEYTRLYTLDTPCKITIEEIATLYGISSNEIGSRINAQDDCRFLIELKDDTELFFYVRNQNKPNDIVNAEIDRILKSSYEKDFIKKSSSGGHYIYKHPNQGWLLLYHPSYDNAIKIQYKRMLSPGLNQTQKEYREQKGYQIAEYLIQKYKD